jgi:fumarylacetoacetase
MAVLNEAHDPARRAWIAAANAPECDFPIQNLPFGVFSTPDRDARGGDQEIGATAKACGASSRCQVSHIVT